MPKRKRPSGANFLPDASKIAQGLRGDYAPEDLHTYRVDRYTFTIFLNGESAPHGEPAEPGEPNEPGINYLTANLFEIDLHMLCNLEPGRPILVNMASCGGDWAPGMQIMSAIAYCKTNPITVLGARWPRSMTSLIPLAADKFVIRAPAPYMIHHGTYGFVGLTQAAHTDHAELVKQSKLTIDLYASRLKEQGAYHHRSEARIRQFLKDRMDRKIDVWLSSGEAVRWGFADALFDGNYDTIRAEKINKPRRARIRELLEKDYDGHLDLFES